MLDMSSRKQRKKIKNTFRNNDIAICKELNEDILIKYIEEICSKPANKEPIIVISNGLTDKQINELLNFKTN